MHLTVHPDVVFKLGADLITDDVQALVELAKNSYDADSRDVSISVDTRIFTHRLTGEASDGGAGGDTVQGRIVVTDHGTGMTREDIQLGWLTVSSSRKREMKLAGKTTPAGRTPLGDKGLGRLGAQRLGGILEIQTVPAGQHVSHEIAIHWRDFESARSLQDIDLPLVTTPTTRSQGTTLIIRDLREASYWQASADDLERDLAMMISPFDDRGFRVRLTIDGEPRDLRKRHDQVRRAALVRYRIEYSDGVLRMHGRVGVPFFRPTRADEQPEYRELVERDNGASFRTWILQTMGARAEGVGLTEGDDVYFIDVSRTVALASLDKAESDAFGPIDPGPFKGEVDAVALRGDSPDSPEGDSIAVSTFDSSAEYRAFVKAINGIRIYRDGFAVRVDRDWVGLGARWSSGTSFYNLRPENVVGFIDISARDNASLIETTNREGFQDTPAYRNFRLLIEEWRRFTEQAQGFVRRAWMDYRKERRDSAVADRPMTPAAIRARAEGRQQALSRTASDAERISRELRTAQLRLDQARDSGSLFVPELEPARQRIDAVLVRADGLIDDLRSLQSGYADALAELDALGAGLQLLQDQLTSSWEAVSLGITAEALSHEIYQISDRLRTRSQAILKHVSAIGIDDPDLHGYIEHVRASAAALRRQVAYLDPALRYVRENRESLLASAIAEDVARHYNDAWSDLPVRVRVDVLSDFRVMINQGRLTQVLDNLLLNSGYWLAEQRRRGESSQGEVIIEVRHPQLRVRDTGPGIDPVMAEAVFEPFFTQKRRGEGRGLGLFVARQLLDSESASIRLEPDAQDDRLRTFCITFENAQKVGG